MYQQLSALLHDRVPELIETIRGEVYPPSPTASALATLLTAFFYIGMIILFIVPNVDLAAVGLSALAPITELTKRYHTILLIALFASNMYASQLLSTGAFEVYMDGHRVWSRLETDELPTAEYLISQIKEFARSR